MNPLRSTEYASAKQEVRCLTKLLRRSERDAKKLKASAEGWEDIAKGWKTYRLIVGWSSITIFCSVAITLAIMVMRS